ncbi:hypothetical protein SAMD00023353_7000070 [Rosellinia necatrix]|uniref:Uncharacterized protein n=1 Tax=Rosellinia necatrix TaxID=77044 RepID=A0A1S8AAH9_ROSNE|nr:hypothetical protein SAMD00023353_7000070 [Rosellinia necatrix]
MMLGLNGTAWLMRTHWLATNPFRLRGSSDGSSVLWALEHTRDLDEIYILLAAEAVKTQGYRRYMHDHGSNIRFSLVEVSESDIHLPNPMYTTGDPDRDMTLHDVVRGLSRRCRYAKIVYGSLDV